MRVFILFVGFQCFLQVAQCQTLKDRIYVGYDVSPSTSFEQVPGASGPTQAFDLQVGSPPIHLGSRFKWIHTSYARIADFKFRGLCDELESASSRFYDLQYGSIFIYDFKKPEWSLFASPRVVMRSDGANRFASDSFFFNGLLFLNYNPDGFDKLVWSFGFVFANDFNRNVLIPVAGVTYNDDHFTIELAYPRVNFLYKPYRRVEWGLTASINGGIFRTEDFSLSTGETARFTRTINVQAGQTLNYLLTSHVVVNSFVGYAVVRNYDLMNKYYEPINAVNTDLKSAWFIRSGVSVRF